MEPLAFTKMHGLGNDFVVIDARAQPFVLSAEQARTLEPLSADQRQLLSQMREWAVRDMLGVPLVFAGYGIAASNPQYDDYAGIDVRGKAVVIFSHEPQENLRTSRLNGRMRKIVMPSTMWNRNGQGSVAKTRRMVEEIGKLTTQPIRYMVICADHGDHIAGNSAHSYTMNRK